MKKHVPNIKGAQNIVSTNNTVQRDIFGGVKCGKLGDQNGDHMVRSPSNNAYYTSLE